MGKNRWTNEEELRMILGNRLGGAAGENITSEDILGATKMGLWVIVVDTNTNISRLYIDEHMRELLCAEEEMSSDEYYDYWYNHINDGYFNYVNNSMQRMLHSGEIVELEYGWIHPKRGVVFVRGVGVQVKKEKGIFVLKGYHRLLSDMHQTRFVENNNQEMFEYNEEKHAIYYHTDCTLLWEADEWEDRFPECWIEQGRVHPYFQDTFREMFTDVQKKRKNRQQDIMLKAKSGEMEWFRIQTQRFAENEKDSHTLLVSVFPVKESQNFQLKYLRKEDFYHAILSDTAAYMELELEGERIREAGGLWKQYEQTAREQNLTYSQMLERYLRETVFEEDYEGYALHMSVEWMRRNNREGNNTYHYQFRRSMDTGEYRWMELAVHMFREQISEKVYVLIYLRDIDEKKRKHLRQEYEARRDPLTNLLNRRYFEMEVRRYMEETVGENELCAIMLFDLDNFKEINDTYGHDSGDRVLNRFADKLQGLFRSTDYVARLGGDEFIVFLKKYQSETALEKRIEGLIAGMQSLDFRFAGCSVGASIIRKENFSYSDSLQKADMALYEAKRSGKNRIAYWKDTQSGEE